MSRITQNVILNLLSMQRKFSTLDMQTKWCSDLEIDALAQLHKIKINVL